MESPGKIAERTGWLIVLFLGSTQLEAVQCRINLIPYGSKFSCGTCHTNPAGGGSRNPFGRDVQTVARQCNAFWNAALASKDSDGDGITNGEELQDPQGTWRQGTPLPGDRAQVTNPGRPDPRPFLRGDASADGKVDVGDVIATLNALFTNAAPPLVCQRAADANGDGKVNVSDVVYTLRFLVSSGSPPPPPFPACGNGPASRLPCRSLPACP